MTIEFHTKTKAGFWAKPAYEAFTFPGGEPHVKPKDPRNTSLGRAELAIVKQPTMADLWMLAAWSDYVRTGGAEVWLAMPYLPFARADRGHPFMADIFVSFIANLVVPKRMVALDPHSSVITERLIKGCDFRLLDLGQLVLDATALRPEFNNYIGVIAPDKGSHDRAQEIASALDLDLYYGGKTRDFSTGKLSGFHLEQPLPYPGRYLIADDICDGGGTFIGLAEAIKAQYGESIELDLWVSHGIFSKSLGFLAEHFGTIYTTDSFFDPDQWAYDDVDYITVRPLSLDLIFGAFK